MSTMRANVATFDHAAFRKDIDTFLWRQRMPKVRLAAVAGISPPSLSLYLNGHTGCDLITASSLALVCDLSLNDYVRAAA